MPAYPRSDVHPICDALDALPAGSTASDVTTALLELFASGRVPLGERLPPERRLAEVLSVGRSAVREALATLETLGVVEARPGAGTFLRATRTAVLSESVRWSMLIGEHELDELVELRSALEIHAAWLAAERGGLATAARLGEHLERMRASLPELGAFIDADRAFHRELARSTGNSTLQDLLDITHGLLRTRVATDPEARRHAEVALVEHERVRVAIAAGDPAAASEAMRAHMRTSAALLRGSVAA
jgi:GntR family transcriptional repressor for pyruvate dehydrogenase complex